ncbi:MAG: DUF799 family lipoprotein [Elusimicrobia bacterium]|nr:DUF799 family lipoprotein [Elusimicrobiota bacterium]
MKPLKILAGISVAFAVASCASRGPIVRHDTPFPSKIALLPMNNLSVDMQGPILVRKLIEDHLIGSGYDIYDVETTDLKLRTISITDGGQLNATTPQELGKLLDVEALLYGELVEFKNMNIGVYSNRVVEAKFRLVDARTGEKLWESTKKQSNKKLGLSSEAIRDQLIEGYATKILENVMKNPLRPESEFVTRQLVKDLNRTRKNW